LSKEIEKEIEKTIAEYLTAVRTGLKEHFDRAFYPDAVVINASESDPEKATVSIQDFAKTIKSRIDKGISVEEKPKATNISYAGRVANVRLDFELRIGEQTLHGTDFFNMVKREHWRISQKIYDVTG